jgi:recombinational DNA repair protein (RecF pathway)
MPDAISSTQLILLTSIFGVLLLLALILTRISNNLSRVSRQLQNVNKRMENPVSMESEIRQKSLSAYETFLSEDPERLKLPKKERFRLYRNWRKEKGLNWAPPQSGS